MYLKLGLELKFLLLLSLFAICLDTLIVNFQLGMCSFPEFLISILSQSFLILVPFQDFFIFVISILEKWNHSRSDFNSGIENMLHWWVWRAFPPLTREVWGALPRNFEKNDYKWCNLSHFLPGAEPIFVKSLNLPGANFFLPGARPFCQMPNLALGTQFRNTGSRSPFHFSYEMWWSVLLFICWLRVVYKCRNFSLMQIPIIRSSNGYT